MRTGKFLIFIADNNVVKTNYSFINVVEATTFKDAQKFAKKLNKSAQVELYNKGLFEFDVKQGFIKKSLIPLVIKALTNPLQIS